MKKYYAIDRIEGQLAICEDDERRQIEILLSEIEGAPKEGDVLCLQNGIYRIDSAETKRRREQILKLQKKLFGEE